jgi:DNA-directed RNA polymerase subunit RPC12/RpoP
MKLTVKCVECGKIFFISEYRKDKPNCKCGWKFVVTEHLDACLNAENEQWIDEPPRHDIITNYIVIPYYVKPWLESRFATIPQDVIVAFKKLMDNINWDKMKYFQKFITKYKLGDIKIFNKNVFIYIGAFPVAYFDRKANNIFIPYGDLDKNGDFNKEEIANQIQHELAHAVDNKILSKNWKGVRLKAQIKEPNSNSNEPRPRF